MDNFVKEFMAAIVIGGNIGLAFALYFSPAEMAITMVCMGAYFILDAGFLLWIRKQNNKLKRTNRADKA
ncbi:MAG: hypothetical protein E6L02_07955 [Thaumarchaeota archaeon]|nr:MAG: hypothetical protein E6L02_07955 [Nitrososphaerota archaeon]